MKNKVVIFLCTISLVLGMASAATALPYKDIDGDNPGQHYIGWFQNVSWHFDLDCDVLAEGDVNAGDIINTA